MMKSLVAVGIVVLILSASAISAANIPNNMDIQNTTNPKITNIIKMVNESLIRGFLEGLVSYGPRVTGTYGCEKAAEYLFEQFENMGLEVRYQNWASFGTGRPVRFYEAKNVEGTILGKDPSKEILVFNGHYDSIKISPGADDDGSGIAAILTAAYILREFEFNRTIKFAAFSGEEQGLLGSRAYAKEAYENNEEIFVELNADMIGYAKGAQGRNVSLSFTEDSRWTVNKIKEVNEDYNLSFNVRSGWPMLQGGPRMGSDYHDFLLYGYESVAFWQSGGGKSYYHTTEDTIAHVNMSYLVNMTKLIVGSLAYLADMENEYPQVKIGSPARGRLYAQDRTLKSLRYEKTIVIDDLLINAEVTPGNAPIEKVEFYYKGKLKSTDTEPPFQWRLNERSIGPHELKVVVYDELGRNASDTMKILFMNLNKKR
jgi:hypothetical protein